MARKSKPAEMFDIFDSAPEKPVGRTDEWLTAQPVLAALGGWQSFDLDPCAPAQQPWPTARQTFTRVQNGLLLPWHGRCWVNPPYATRLLRAFMARLVGHGRGTALIPAATDTDAFAQFVWGAATAVLFPLGRLTFHRPDGSVARRLGATAGAQRADHASVLVAFGRDDADRLAFSGLAGQFIALRIPRGVLVLALGDYDPKCETQTWRQVVAAQLAASPGPVRLDDLYRAVASHPKAGRNPHWRAKVRQQVQLLGQRTGRAEWRARA